MYRCLSLCPCATHERGNYFNSSSVASNIAGKLSTSSSHTNTGKYGIKFTKHNHPNATVQILKMPTSTKRTSKYIRRSHKQIMKVYSQIECSSLPSEADCSEDSLKKKKDPSRVPVFRLPKNRRLSSIPEEAEVQWGFIVALQLQQQQEGREEEIRETNCKRKRKKPTPKRRFSGLVSLSNPNKQLIERSATTDIEFRSYSTSNIPIGAKAA